MKVTITLAGMLAEAKGGPINYQGRDVMMSHKIPIINGQEILVEILKYKNDAVEQGFEVSVDQRKGVVDVNDQKIKAPVFWTETAPKIFSFKCYSKKATGVINIWNVWRNINRKDRVEAWIGNAGLYIEEDGNGTVIFYCSSGVHQVDFEDFVFSIKVK